MNDSIPDALDVVTTNGATRVQLPLDDDQAHASESLDAATFWAARFLFLTFAVCLGAALTLWSTGGTLVGVLAVLLVPVPWILIVAIGRFVLKRRIRGRPWVEIRSSDIRWGWDSLAETAMDDHDAVLTANAEVELDDADEEDAVLSIRDSEVPDHGLVLELPVDQARYLHGLVQKARV